MLKFVGTMFICFNDLTFFNIYKRRTPKDSNGKFTMNINLIHIWSVVDFKCFSKSYDLLISKSNAKNKTKKLIDFVFSSILGI